jgi:hypothetical protein
MSVKANELRIGNYFNHRLSYQPLKVKEIKNDVVIDEKNMSCCYLYIEPIPLTEQILLKCGFEKIKSFVDWTKRNHVLKSKDFNFPVYDHMNINMYFYSLNGNNYFFYNGIDISVNNMPNLHQLQNLYFALTTQELEVNF